MASFAEQFGILSSLGFCSGARIYQEMAPHHNWITNTYYNILHPNSSRPYHVTNNTTIHSPHMLPVACNYSLLLNPLLEAVVLIRQQESMKEQSENKFIIHSVAVVSCLSGLYHPIHKQCVTPTVPTGINMLLDMRLTCDWISLRCSMCK